MDISVTNSQGHARLQEAGSEPVRYPVTAKDVVQMWNEMASRKNLPMTQRVDDQRAGIVRFLLKQFPDLHVKKNWRRYFRIIGRSPVLSARSESGYRVTLDWALSRTNLIRVMSGEFDAPPVEEAESVAPEQIVGEMPPSASATMMAGGPLSY